MENIVYIQHSYNKSIHTSIHNSPFLKLVLDIFHLHTLDVVYGQWAEVREDTTSEELRAKKFIKFRKIHLQVQQTLKKSQ